MFESVQFDDVVKLTDYPVTQIRSLKMIAEDAINRMRKNKNCTDEKCNI